MRMFKNIHSAFLAAFTVIIVPVTAVFVWISFRFTEESILENSQKYVSQLVEQVNDKVDFYLDYMDNTSWMLLFHSDVGDYLSREFTDDEQKKKMAAGIADQFSNILSTRSDIYCIAAYGQNGRLVVNGGKEIINRNTNISERSWYKSALEANGETVITSSHVQNVIYDRYPWVVSLSRAVRVPGGEKPVGVLWIDLNYNAISDLCRSIDLGSRGYIFVLDQDGQIVYHPQQQLLHSGLKDERISDVMEMGSGHFLTDPDVKKAKLYTCSRSESTGWTVVGVVDATELFKNEENAKRLYLLTAILLSIAAVVVSLILSGYMTRPIRALKNSMREVEKGNFRVTGPILKDDSEIGKLGRSFSMMVDKIQILMEEQIKEQKLKRRSELKVLQSQINPHFLYNTLDSIVWMAESGRDEEVVIMTSSLARLLRQSISNEAEFVTVDQEVQYVSSYLTIQKMRYRDQLSYEIEVDPSIRSKEMIKMILQPLVENALYHGIKYKEEPGTIRVRGFMQGDRMILEVEDDGIGMDEEQLAHIFDRKEPDERSNGVGVRNVQERIQLYYGKEYGLTYSSKKDRGTAVRVNLPADCEGAGFKLQ